MSNWSPELKEERDKLVDYLDHKLYEYIMENYGNEVVYGIVMDSIVQFQARTVVKIFKGIPSNKERLDFYRSCKVAYKEMIEHARGIYRGIRVGKIKLNPHFYKKGEL